VGVESNAIRRPTQLDLPVETRARTFWATKEIETQWWLKPQEKAIGEIVSSFYD
jgi:hypothetical protein